jgi:hypothetical protein
MFQGALRFSGHSLVKAPEPEGGLSAIPQDYLSVNPHPEYSEEKANVRAMVAGFW